MSLALKFVTTIEADVAEPIIVGKTPVGNRMVVPVVGGKFTGHEFSGTVLHTGSDWNFYRPEDEGLEIWARYDLTTEDGWNISIINEGVGHVSPDVPMKVLAAEDIGTGTWIMKTRPRFEAPIDSPYAWMNRSVFVAEIPFPTKPLLVTIHVYEVVID
jgi:hypothetical protein